MVKGEAKPGQSTQGMESGFGMFGMPMMAPPDFEYEHPAAFFKQFKRYARVVNLTANRAHDLLCFTLGACARSRWLADQVETSVKPDGTEAEGLIGAVEKVVLKALQPEVLKNQILQDVDRKTLKVGQSPRDFVEEIRVQLLDVMPELSKESLDRLLILRAIKASPVGWQEKLIQANFTTVDDLIHKMTVLQNAQAAGHRQQVAGQGQLTSRRVQVRNRRCYSCGSPNHLARDCGSKSQTLGSEKCSNCGLKGHNAASCRVKCRNCGKVGHIAKNCPGSSVPSRRVVVGSSYHLDVTVMGQEIPGVMDSGSERTLLSKETADLLGVQMRDTNRRVVGVALEQLTVYGSCCLDLTVGSHMVNMEVLVTDCRDQLILGTDFLRAAEVSMDFGTGSVSVFGEVVGQTPVTVCRCTVADSVDDQVLPGADVDDDFVHPLQKGMRQQHCTDLTHFQDGEREQMTSVLEEFDDVFSKNGELGHVVGVEHVIELEANPKRSKPYPVPCALKGVVQEQIDDMLSQGVIRKCSSPYASPVLLVPKRHRPDEPPVYRFCTDFRELNRVTVKDRHPLPRIESLLAAVGPDNCVFTQLDQKAAYWQLPIRECDQEKTAFVTEDAQYCYCVLPYGLSNGPSSYQRLMMQVLGDLMWKSVLVYLDDVLIFSRTMEEHVEVLREVFTRFRQHHLKLNPAKCGFALSQVTFLGHVLSGGCVRPAADNVAAVRNYRRPTTRPEVRRFLGLCGFMRHFVPNFSTRAAPLTDLTSDKNPFVWTDDCEKSFEDLKCAISSYPVVRSADTDKPFVLTTDACQRGWGCTLSQTCDGKENVVAYASGKWTGPESRFSTTEQELLAVIRSITRFRYFLLGVMFTVVTDHQALRWLWKLSDPTGRLARWIMCLSQYSFRVVHRRGIDIPHADALSRSPEGDQTEEAVTESDGYARGTGRDGH